MSLTTSILMSVYYRENARFFDEAIDSILVKQTQKADEFILVCDGPLTSELDSIVAKYSDLYPDVFKVYRTEHNQGLGNALNYGLEKCSSEIIIRADSDDICASDRIKTQVDYFSSHPDVSIVSSYIDEFNDFWDKPINVKKLPLSHDELVQMAKFRNPINHMAVAFRRDVILAIGSYKHIPYVEDYELWVRAIIQGYKLGNIDRVLVHARIGNGMVKRRGNRQYIKSWRELNNYMLDKNVITRVEYLRNMLAVRIFVYMPAGLKKLVYKRILRK